MNFKEIEIKHKDLINISKTYMKQIKDNEHNNKHVEDVVENIKILLNNIEENFDIDVCIISAYWHDVGRIKQNKGHEIISAKMLKKEMKKLNYNLSFIEKCYQAILNHKWNMNPTTIEGLLLKDADKLAWLGKRRWKECLEHNQNLDSIIELLPKLKNQILYFEYSKTLYDKLIIELLEMLYKKI